MLHGRGCPEAHRREEGKGTCGGRASEKGLRLLGRVAQHHHGESLGQKGHSNLGSYSHKAHSLSMASSCLVMFAG